MIFSKKQYFIYITIIIIFIILSYNFFDKIAAQFFLANTDKYEYIGDILSLAGDSVWYIAIAIIGSVFFRYIKFDKLISKNFLFLLYAIICSGILTLILKVIFGRIRPLGLIDGNYGFLLFKDFNLGLMMKIQHHMDVILTAQASYLSFPSGHATTIFAVATYMSILFTKHAYLWVFVAFTVSIGRLLATSHFISDILAAMLVGTIMPIFIYSLMYKKNN